MESVSPELTTPRFDRCKVRPVFAFEERGRRLAFVVDSAAFVEIDEVSGALVDEVAGRSESSVLALHGALDARFGRAAVAEAIDAFRRLDVLLPPDAPVATPEAQVHVRPGVGSLVLHVSHDCNLRCGYCYAEYGWYGGEAGSMAIDMAVRWVDTLFDRAGDRKVLHLTLFGGEPLLNFPAVTAAIDHGRARAEREGRELRIGLTTNGTLLTREIARYLRDNRVTVSISLDGPADVNDKLRPFAEGRGSTYQTVVDAVRSSGIRAVARVTLTRRSTDVARIVRSLVDVGFVEIGVAPVATGKDVYDLGPREHEKALEGFAVLADDFVAAAREGRLFPFSNVKNLVSQIHGGEVRGMPCGAGLELVAGDMQGNLYACHRFVGDETKRMGSIDGGIDAERRLSFLRDNHMKKRPECGKCWARYLCGGGCHHIAHVQTVPGEVVQISGATCDFLRGFYRLGLSTYARLVEEAPDFLAQLTGDRDACSQPTGL